MPVVIIKIADHYALRGGCMHKVVVHQVYAYMGNVAAVYMKKYKVTLIGFAGVLYPFAF